jgi:uncharacterized protein (TIGR03086 family)
MAHHEFADRRDLAAAVTVWTPTSSERYFRHKRRRREEIIRLPHTTADQAGSRTSASSSAKPSGSTHTKPARSRPANCIGRTYGSSSACWRLQACRLTGHGWDIAAATGHDYAGETELVQAAYAFAQSAVAQNPDGNPGPFGPPVAVPEFAPLLDRLIGLTGRDPAWQPAGRN